MWACASTGSGSGVEKAGIKCKSHQGYYDQLTSITNDFKALDPPSKYKGFQDYYVDSCESLSRGLASIIDGIRIFQNLDENTEARINSTKEATARYLNEAEELSNKAQEAWPDSL